MADTIKIDPKRDGPLQVNGTVRLCNSAGETLATETRFWLCRCGGSGNKPFCDGTHKHNRFSSARQSDPAQGVTRRYAGRNITIHDNRSVCAHAGHCTGHSPSVFSMDAEPWIDADADTAARTIATIGMCPSGALAYSIDGLLHEPSGRLPSIQVTKDGPYAIVGGVPLEGDATPLSHEHYTLCRCGQSKNKPFCDGAHWQAGFKDEKN